MRSRQSGRPQIRAGLWRLMPRSVRSAVLSTSRREKVACGGSAGLRSFWQHASALHGPPQVEEAGSRDWCRPPEPARSSTDDRGGRERRPSRRCRRHPRLRPNWMEDLDPEEGARDRRPGVESWSPPCGANEGLWCSPPAMHLRAFRCTGAYGDHPPGGALCTTADAAATARKTRPNGRTADGEAHCAGGRRRRRVINRRSSCTLLSEGTGGAGLNTHPIRP